VVSRQDVVRYTAAILLVAVAFGFAVMTTTVAFNQIAGHQEHQRAIVDATFAQRAAFVALVDEETGVRGYLATGNPGFLEPYRDGERRYAAYLAHPPAVDDAAAQAEVTRFAASAATARNLFRAQVADVAHGRRVHALARLPAERRAFDAVRRDEAATSDALQRALAAGTATTRIALDEARTATIIMAIMLIGAGMFSTVTNVRARQSARLARRDTVTRLPNRRAFEERLRVALAERRPEAHLAVLYIDIDGFKPVNDRLGHTAGDTLLAAFGERLRRSVRPADFVARIGGDEFAAILDLASPAGAATISARILSDVEQPYVVGGASTHVGASIGIAVAPRDGVEPRRIVDVADAAMYREKRRRTATG